MEIRLNKFISDSGFCSRREADKMIESGKVTINSKCAAVGDRVSSGDVVRVNGMVIENDIETVYLALNKPIGIVSTTDPSEPNNIVDFVNYPHRIFNIGRLDKDSEGLILLTNDGNIVNKILRASNNHEKEYEVSVNKPITDLFIERMGAGVQILGTTTKKCKIEQEGTFNFRITLTQGLNRQIRRMCEALGYEVVKLKRVRIMNIKLNKLESGHWRDLTQEEVKELISSLKGSDGSEKASKGAGVGVRRKTTRRTNKFGTPYDKSRRSKSNSDSSERGSNLGRPQSKVAKGGKSSDRFKPERAKSGKPSRQRVSKRTRS